LWPEVVVVAVPTIIMQVVVAQEDYYMESRYLY
jgi:hypothetical protein